MESNPTDVDPSPQKALALAAFFTVVAIVELHTFQNALTTPLRDAWLAFRTSPWAVATLVDYSVGAVFASLYLSLRPALAAAVATPLLGSFVLLLYMAAALVHTRDINAALLPRSRSLDLCSPRHARPAFWGFAALLVFFGTVCAWAWVGESLHHGYTVIKTTPWIEMTFLDNLGGLVFTVAFVVVREGGLSCVVAAWLLAFLLFGNAATCVYVMLVARDAINYDISFEQMLLSKRAIQ